MIKTIKVKKTKDLSELIAHISMNGIRDANFVSDYENIVSADHSGQITTVGKFYNDTFIVEVEEEITEDTLFEMLTEVFYNVSSESVESIKIPDARISYILGEQRHSEDFETLAIYYGKTLIWEAE